MRTEPILKKQNLTLLEAKNATLPTKKNQLKNNSSKKAN